MVRQDGSRSNSPFLPAQPVARGHVTVGASVGRMRHKGDMHALPSRAAGLDGRPCTLITIPISHYCEKARWALDRAGVRYRERPHLQLVHWLAVRRAGGGRTAPVLVCGDRVLAESGDILEAADAGLPPGRRLYPDGDLAAAEVRALEREFDERLGPQGRLWMYDALRGRREIAIAYACTGVPAWERRALPLAYPLVTRIIDRYLGITPAAAARSEAEVRAVFARVAKRLEDGRPYLCGDRFTAADLTFAALAAAVLMPPEYGVPLPQPDELPEPMAAVVRELRTHPAGAHALAMFRTERRSPSAEGHQMIDP
jgi:glutathione S-transferase